MVVVMKKTLFLIFCMFFTQTAYANDSSLKVGVILPLTGPLADFGVAIKNGIELYGIEHPESVPKISYIYEDDQYDAKNSISAYRKLASLDNIDVYFSFGSPACSALAPIVDKDNNLMLCFTPDENSSNKSKNVLRAHNGSNGFMEPLLRYLRGKEEKDFKIVKTEMGYVNSLLDSFQKMMLPSEKFSVEAAFNPSEIDFRAVILRLKSQKVRTLGLFLMPSQLISFMKQARDVNYQFDVFTTNLIESAFTLTNGELLNGAVYSYLVVDESFKDKYLLKYNSDAQLAIAVNSYDMAGVLDSGFRVGADKSIGALFEIFKKVSKKSGVSGDFSYREDEVNGKYFEYVFHMKKVVDRKGEVIR